MAELVVRNVEPALVSRLKQRAEMHHRSVEEEHREILRDVLSLNEQETGATTFESFFDVGEDADFSRIGGMMRDIDFAE